MTTTIEAIYERGVLRLKEPIALAEGAQVEVIVISRDAEIGTSKPAEILAAIAALSSESKNGEFSGSDHDQVIYDSEDAQ